MIAISDRFQKSETSGVIPFWKPLRRELFRMLWIANIVSNFGTWMHVAASTWIMADLSLSPLMVALVNTASTLPIFFFVLPAGVLSDILPRPRYLLFTQSLMAISACAMGVCALMGWLSPYVLLTFTFLLAVGNALNMPAWQAAMSSLVDREDLPLAASLNNLSYNLALAFGPVLAGWIIGHVGAGYVFLFNAASFLMLIGVFYRWNRSEPQVVQKTEWRQSFQTAGKLFLLPGRFRSVLIRTFMFFFTANALWSLLPSFAHDVLHGNASGYGLLMSSLGMGAICAAFILPHVRARFSTDEICLGSMGVFAVGLALATIFTSLFLLPVIFGCMGMAWGTSIATLNAATHSTFAPSIRARGISCYLVVFYGALASGSGAWGQLATVSDTSTAWRVAALMLLLCIPIAHRWRINTTAAELNT
jgi:MFS family permease